MNVAELREALELFRSAPWDYHDTIGEDTVVDAARELLTIRESGALIITPDEMVRKELDAYARGVNWRVFETDEPVAVEHDGVAGWWIPQFRDAMPGSRE